MILRPFKILLWGMLWLLCSLSAAGQEQGSADIEQLTRDMYRLFMTNDYQKFMETTTKLKEASLKVGDLKTFYKAWGNEILLIKKHLGRPQAMQTIKEMRDYATEHDHKFGLYTSTYTMAYILHQVGDIQGAIESYQKALDYLNRFFPEESTAPIYLSMSTASNALKRDSTAIRYSEKALADPLASKLQKYLAMCYICQSWGWLRNKERFDEAYAKLRAIMDSTSQDGMRPPRAADRPSTPSKLPSPSSSAMPNRATTSR